MNTNFNSSAMEYDLKAQKTLLEAVRAIFFNVDNPPEAYDDFFDGRRLADILHNLDASFDVSILVDAGDEDEDKKGSAGLSLHGLRRANITVVYKGLFRFIRQQIPELQCQYKKFDFPRIAENPQAKGISQMLAVMISAALLHPERSRDYISSIMELSTVAQKTIMMIVQTMQQEGRDASNNDDLEETLDAITEARDIDLVVEEQNAELRRSVDQHKKMLSDYVTRLENLQLSYEELKYEKEQNDHELDNLRQATQDGVSSAGTIKILEARVNEQMEIIASHEEEVDKNNKEKLSLQAEVEKLQQKADIVDELRDQNSELRYRTEELEKKANTADRYKQKLEAQQDLEKNYKNLQFEHRALMEQLRDFQEESEKGAHTRKREEELTRMLTQSEQHLWDERNQRQQLSRDLTAVEDEVMRLRARQQHDEGLIAELQEQVDSGTGGGHRASSGPLNLEDELNDADEDGEGLRLKYSRLEAENRMLRKNMGSTGDSGLLRRENEELKRSREELQQNFNDMFEKYTLSQSQVEALSSDNAGEGTEAFKKIRGELMQTIATIKTTERKLEQVQNQLSDKEREVVRLKSQLAAAESDGLEAAVEELKKTDEFLAEDLQDQLNRLREEHQALISTAEGQKDQLVSLFTSNDKLRKQVEDQKELQDTAVASNETEGLKSKQELIVKLRERLVERQQQLENSEQERLELRKQLRAIEGGEAAMAQKAATDQIIRNLERENNLITSAWYDLTSRIQSNHVVLQRRNDPPRSWLNKQRQMVNATPRG